MAQMRLWVEEKGVREVRQVIRGLGGKGRQRGKGGGSVRWGGGETEDGDGRDVYRHDTVP